MKKNRSFPIIMFLVLLVAFCFPQVSIVEASPGWLSGWGYRKSHVINNATGAGTNYQVKITCHYGSGSDSGGDVYLNSHSRTDFGDVRFTDNDETTLLDYWMESKTDSDNAVFWVEIQDDISSSSATIYVYYGKSDATTTSDGDYTFIFFDDFPGDSVNTTKWDVDAGRGTITVSDGEVRINASEGTGINPAMRTDNTFDPLNKKFECRLKFAVLDDVRMYGFNAKNDADTRKWYWVGLSVSGDDDYFLDVDGSGYDFQWDLGGWATDTYYRVTSAHKTGKNVAERDASSNTYTTKSFSPGEALRVLLGFYFYGYNDATSNRIDMYVDWTFIRKWVDPEPTHGSWGSEEEGGGDGGTAAYQFYGILDEDTGLLVPLSERAVNVTAYFAAVANEQFEVNGSYLYEPSLTPLYFRFELSTPREYWVSEQDHPIWQEIWIFNTTLTTYYIEFIDLAGTLDDYSYVTAQRKVNGSLTPVEKRKVDVNNRVTMNLKQAEKYTIVIQDGATYTFGDLTMTTDTNPQLTLKGIEFPKETLLTYKYVRIYGERGFSTPTGSIKIIYQDTLAQTENVTLYFRYENGTTVHTYSTSADEFSYNWTSAVNNTNYLVQADITHTKYGSYPWRQLFPSTSLTTNPWALDFLGSLAFNVNMLIPILIIAFVGGCFSVIDAELGAFMMVIAAIIVVYMWGIPIGSGTLIVAFTLAILMAIIYAKRKVEI